MITRYITYIKECPVHASKPTEFELAPPKLKKEYESMSHELVNVNIAGDRIYYTFRVDIKLKGLQLATGSNDTEEVSPFER